MTSFIDGGNQSSRENHRAAASHWKVLHKELYQVHLNYGQ